LAAGTASAIRQGDTADISAGGAGRLVLGRMFDDGDGLYLGVELGGSAQVPKDEMTGERSQVVIGADIVTPIVYRHTLLNTYVEFEPAGSDTRPKPIGARSTTACTWASHSVGARCGNGSCSQVQRSPWHGSACSSTVTT